MHIKILNSQTLSKQNRNAIIFICMRRKLLIVSSNNFILSLRLIIISNLLLETDI
jgi:hypothetical protein